MEQIEDAQDLTAERPAHLQKNLSTAQIAPEAPRSGLTLKTASAKTSSSATCTSITSSCVHTCAVITSTAVTPAGPIINLNLGTFLFCSSNITGHLACRRSQVRISRGYIREKVGGIGRATLSANVSLFSTETNQNNLICIALALPNTLSEHTSHYLGCRRIRRRTTPD